MIGRVALLVVTLAIGGSPSLAGGEKALHCDRFDASDLGKGFYATKATPGQMHFIAGMWAVLPSAPGLVPPGDGALIIRKKGEMGGAIAITKGGAACAILPAPEALLRAMAGIKTGPLDKGGDEI